LFTSKSDRKKEGRVFRQAPKDALPLFRIQFDGPLDYESKVIADLSEKEEDGAAIRDGGTDG
jgi:hypothetical protein